MNVSEYIFIVIICLVIINCVLLPCLWKKFERVNNIEKTFDNYRDQYILPGENSLKRFVFDEKYDCDKTSTLCVSDEDCNMLCVSVNYEKFTCHKSSQLCLRKNTIETYDIKTPAVDILDDTSVLKCFPNKGVVAALQADPQFGVSSWTCISLFPHLIDNRGEKLRGVCDGINSKLKINLKAHYPRIEDCICSNDRTLITFSGRTFGEIKSSDDIPRCVLYPFLYN